MGVMKAIKLPFGETVIAMGSDEQAKKNQCIINRRWAFAQKYIAEKGWCIDRIEDLSIDQLIEIRSQPEWKNAGEE